MFCTGAAATCCCCAGLCDFSSVRSVLATSYFSSNVMPAFWASVSKHLSGRSEFLADVAVVLVVDDDADDELLLLET